MWNLVHSWMEFGLSEGMETWVGSHLLMFPGVRSSMMVQSSGVELSACGFLS